MILHKIIYIRNEKYGELFDITDLYQIFIFIVFIFEISQII